MANEDFKTRLKIAKKKLKNYSEIKDNNQNGSFMGSAFKLGTELDIGCTSWDNNWVYFR